MPISISNIAWDTDLDEEVSVILKGRGISAIDIAPGKYFSDLSRVLDTDIQVVKSWWNQRGFDIVGMQSLLFGTKGLNVFGTTEQQQNLLTQLKHVFRIAHLLGAKKLVFGSPKNRDRSGLSDQEAQQIALDFFYEVGNSAKDWDVELCIEPNPTIYGANFLTRTLDAYNFVKILNHSNIKLQLDLGTMLVNHEDPSIITEIADVIGHIHISEPNLSVIGCSKNALYSQYCEMINALPNQYKTIEMLTTASKTVEQIQSALTFVAQRYK